jgi:cardiolipin synthase
VRIEGAEVAREAERLFEMAWRRADVYGEPRRPTARLTAGLRAQVRKLAGIGRAWRRVARAADTPHEDQGVPVLLISNEEFRYRWAIRRAYLYAIEHARSYVLIENAYFIPTLAVRRALARAVKRGVVVAVAVPCFSDVPIVAYAGRHLYAGLLKRGVRILEWPHGMLHAKTAVIDDAWAIVGSYNFDHRSLFSQLEAVAVVVDPDFARRLREQTLADLSRCHEVTRREHAARSFVRRALESAAYRLRDWL